MRLTARPGIPALAAAAALALFWPGECSADLKKAMAQPDLEKRSALALDNALAALSAARKAYDGGEMDSVKADAAEIQESVELASTSLRQSGKDPRKHPTYFKRAEISTRDLSRRLESFAADMSYVDRPVFDQLRKRVQQIHDEILEELLEGKK